MTVSALARLRYASMKLWASAQRPATLLRAVPLLGVYGAAVWLLHRGPVGDPPLSWPMALYHALRYFTLDAIWLPNPETPRGWMILGWSVAFGAPAITAGVLIEGALALRRSLGGPELQARALRDHVIVCGYGAHGRAIASVAVARGLGCALVDREGDGSARVGERDLPLLVGDMADPELLEQAGIRRARAVYFATGDPLMNLGGALVASELLGEGHGPRLFALVDDVEAERSLLDALTMRGARTIELIDQFGAAAGQLLGSVLDDLRTCVGRAAPRVAILGFGRFGSALARELFERVTPDPGARCTPTLVLVDLKAGHRVVDLTVPKPWKLEIAAQDVEQWVAETARRPPDFVFLTTSDDATNLRCAARLRRHGREVPVVLRMLNPPRHLEQRHHGVVARNIVGLFQEHFAKRPELG